MHVLQMLLISLEEIYDCYVTQECYNHHALATCPDQM